MLKRRTLFNIALMTFFVFSAPLRAEEQPQEMKPIEVPQTSEMVMFTTPEGWRMIESKELLPSVKAMVVGKGAYEFPPSINLGTEPYTGTLKQYLKRIKDINTSQGAEWKDLGSIRTQAGDASFSQVDRKTEWGDVRMMHVILIKDGTVYIMTAAARKEEFPTFYKTFFTALSSLRFEKPSK